MIRGTTAQFKFKLPCPKEDLSWATIKFWQDGNLSPYLPITKKLEHCDSPDNSTELYVSLTPDETMRFSEKRIAQVQMRAQNKFTGTTFGNLTKLIKVYPMKDDILEENPTMPAPNEEGWIVLDGETIVD